MVSHPNGDGESVRRTLHGFFENYLQRRDLTATLAMVSDTVCSVGTGEGEVAHGKDAFRALLEAEFAALPNPIAFTITDYVQQQLQPGCWDCFCNLNTLVDLPGGSRAAYRMRLTAGVRRQADGVWRMEILHASEASQFQESGEFLLLNFLSSTAGTMSRETRQDLLEIVGQIMSGGIMGGYLEPGYPLYVANEKLLHMAGYDTCEEFERDIHGLVLNSIHPDDWDMVNGAMGGLAHLGDQYEIQYRMRKKDGSYLWVHDIGRRTVATDGREAIISVLIDISRQIQTQEFLKNEAATDPLTGIYNRKGGQNRIAQQMEQADSYLFLMMDLDNFKRVNDYYGHQEGDQALCHVARLLRESFRKTDVICRLGGDEFAVFVPDCVDLGAMERKLEQLLDDCRRDLYRSWPKARSTLSIGGVWGRQRRTFQDLYRLADDVLYQVKRSGKDCQKIQRLDA